MLKFELGEGITKSGKRNVRRSMKKIGAFSHKADGWTSAATAVSFSLAL
jgi:hypothetical protein